MPVISLPDGSQRSFESAVTVRDVAASIGPGLAKAALAARIDGRLVDTSCLIESDVALEIVTDKSADALEVIRHSAAHLLAQAVKQLFPSAQVTIGPVIDDGFFYDFAFERTFTPDDLAAIATKFVDGAFELLGLEVGKNDLHAFGQEPLTHGLADTAGATSDDCNLAFEFLHCSPFEQIRTLVLLARVWVPDHRSLG